MSSSSPSDGPPSWLERGLCSSGHAKENPPPISVIVLQDATPMSTSSRQVSDHYSPEGTGSGLGIIARKTNNSPATASSFTSGGFRLQPRNPKCIPSPLHGKQDPRGIKRRADSLTDDTPLSSTFESSASDTITAVTHATTKGSPLASPVPAGEQALAYFQGLSLHSPVSSSPYRRRLMQTATTDSPISLVGSQGNRSSFLKYNSASPMSYAAGTSPGSASFMSKSPSLSPKRAPCTVLFGQSVSAATSEATRCTRLGSPEVGSKRPPLHSGMTHLMHSLEETSSVIMDLPCGFKIKDPPLSAVHCHATTASMLASPGSHDSRLTDSMTYMTNANLYASPCSKQSRTHELDSPSRWSVLSPSNQTPLPRLTLTPRSVDSQRNRSTEMPVFPMDLDTDTTAAGIDSRSSIFGIKTPPSIIRQEKQKRGSFFPSHDWNEPSRCESMTHTLSPRPPKVSGTNPPKMVIASVAPSVHSPYDNDSLSASDDDGDDFFLAAPCVINEEKRAHSCKQRKIDFLTPEMPPRRLPSALSLRSGLASNTSLHGMDFVTSSSNLQNMERVGSKVLSQASFEELSNLNQPDLTESDLEQREEEFSTYVGLALDTGHTSSPCKAFDADSTRDLKTPPAIRTETASPPPLLHASHHASKCDEYLLQMK